MDAIRDVFERCRLNRQPLHVQPFGDFDWAACGGALGDLLYRYEASLDHWDKALEVAEMLAAKNRDAEAIFPHWILSQAKCLVRLGREGDALTLLMAHRDVYNAKAPVNLYLEELRSGRG